jgi:hypothetical protein
MLLGKKHHAQKKAIVGLKISDQDDRYLAHIFNL